MQNTSSAEADRFYVNQSGVKGHQQLDKTMSRVESKATDDSLKSLATAARPLVLTHLQVSRDVLSNMSGNGNNRNGGSVNSSGSGNNSGGSSNMSGSDSSGGSMNVNSNSGMNSNRNRNSNSNRGSNSNGNSSGNSNGNINR